MSTTIKRDPMVDSDWSDLAIEWQIRSDSIYLNHGSFGPPPQVVRHARRRWIDALDEQPMDFYNRLLEPALDHARDRTAKFIGTERGNIVFVENATSAMNIVADSFPLKPGDEVLLNNHEYGAVHRIWERRCERAGADCHSVELPKRIESRQQVVDSILNAVTDKTRLVVVSHITSATALIMPIQELCDELRQRGVAICVDGPHALAQIPLNVESLGCDFYAASCHKWLCASLGTGLLYVQPKWHEHIQPTQKSWGRLLPAIPERWDEEFTWSGTRDPSGYLTIPAGIDFIAEIGFDAFRARSYALATHAEKLLAEQFGTKPIADRAQGWYGSMAHVPLPAGDWSKLQQQLWEIHKIEIPIIFFGNEWFVRVSCHLYNNQLHLETLSNALGHLIRKQG